MITVTTYPGAAYSEADVDGDGMDDCTQDSDGDGWGNPSPSPSTMQPMVQTVMTLMRLCTRRGC